MPGILTQSTGELTPFCQALLTELLEQLSSREDCILSKPESQSTPYEGLHPVQEDCCH
jgi:hypothetical protein